VTTLPLNYHYMQLPREVIVGKGTLNRVPEVAKRLGLKGPALIVAGHTSCEIAGKKVCDLLVDSGVEVDSILVEKALMSDISAIEKRITEMHPQILFGVGGGTKIDAAKLSASHQGLPFVSVPTTLSHDGIASPLASVKGLDKPYSALSQAPLAIIADTTVISQEPWRFVISGCGDVLAKFTAVKDWRLAHLERGEYYGEYAASLALMSATLVEENIDHIKPGNEEGTQLLLEALISCGVAMSIAGSSRPCSGSEHLFSHALDKLNGSTSMHGEQCGVGSILIAYLYGANWKRIRESLHRLGAPTSAAELGTTDEKLVEAFELAASIRPERYTILQKLCLNHAACQEVAKVTHTIE
jgi:glycerol-1-phosphate dehydrogenase [NAD(P)+]